jgi:hypothetical protein
MDLRIASFNMHGYNNGSPMLDMLCRDFDLIFLQEHWLLPANVNMLMNFNNLFSGVVISGCLDVEQFAHSGGRPYGGVGILWRRDLNCKCKVLGFDDSHRCIVIKIDFGSCSLVCANVYLPTFNNTDSYEEDILSCFAFIESLFMLHADGQTNFVILGDCNFDCERLRKSSRLLLVRNFLNDYSLESCDHLDENKLGYSYRHEGLNVQSLIDHAFVTVDLLNKISKFALLDCGLNFSDHCAVSFNVWLDNVADGGGGVASSFDGAKTDYSTKNINVNYLWDSQDILNYQKISNDMLRVFLCTYPHLSCCFPCHCSNHNVCINTFAEQLMNILKDAADSGVKHKVAGYAKPYWSDDLSMLKRLSVEAHLAWVAQGRPRFGAVNDNRLLCKSRYKHAFRLARRNFERSVSDKLAAKLLNGDSKSFWAEWNAKFVASKNANYEISGITSPDVISQGFAKYFSVNFCDSNANINMRDKFNNVYDKLVVDSANSVYMPFTVNEVRLAIADLKKGKAAGLDKVTPEMIVYAGDLLPLAITILFNMCLVHGFVPSSFSMSVIVPVVKDKNGKCNDYENFRPISLVNMLSKVFELCISLRLSNLFKVDDLQFGFVEGKGCQKALFSLETIVNYYTCRGSTVFMAALDATKAFDRINHYALFYKLICLGIPLCLLNVIINLHLNLCGCVRWQGVLSSVFSIKSGVRQGGVISPWFFNIYINDLIGRLRKSGYGCHLCNEFFGCLFFADDILLLSGSILHLQLMLDICVSYGVEFDIVFNKVKSVLMQIGLDADVVLPQLSLNGEWLKWVSRIRYLGVWICCDRVFNVDISANSTKFMGCTYGILQKCGTVSEEVRWNVIKHSSEPILFYGVDVLQLKSEQVHKLSVVYNNAVRRCFNLPRNRTVRDILFFTGSLPVKIALNQRRILLIKDCLRCTGIIRLCALFSSNDIDFVNTCMEYDIHLEMTCGMIRKSVCDKFVNDLRVNQLL